MIKDFPQAKLDEIRRKLDEIVPKIRGPKYAAFDADGTLWNTDLGEALFDYQVKNKLVPLPADPWAHYEEMKQKISFPAAYLWLAQINKDVPLKQVREWAKTAVENVQPVPVFESQRAIIKHLQSLDVKVFIVTASVKWAVEPGAPLLGLTADNVIGVRTKVTSDGLVTDIQEGAVTFREGKVEALMAQTGGIRPLFAAGNTMGDVFLLESSIGLRLAVTAMPSGNKYYQSEQELMGIAKERGWYFHNY